MIFNPKVTIAMPVYNTELYMARSLNSVINQDYNNIEILIVYDVSEDDSLNVTKNVLRNCPFPYEIIEKSKANKGLGKSGNVAINNFKGDYLFFLDCDDYLEPFTISLLVKEAISNNADIVAGSHRSVDEEYAPLIEYKYNKKKIFTNNSSFRNYCYVENGYFAVYVWNKLYKSSFIKENKFKFIYNIINDVAFTFLVVKKAVKVVLLPEITLNYLIRSSSITNAIMYNDLSLETAETYISIRDFELTLNDNQILEDVCSNIDVFNFCYIMIVRDSYKSKNISKKDKLELCRNAFKTPAIPLKMFSPLLYSKKKKLLLLLVVKILPYRLNILVVNLYHKLKSV